MTEQELQKLEKLCEVATPGPWETYDKRDNLYKRDKHASSYCVVIRPKILHKNWPHAKCAKGNGYKICRATRADENPIPNLEFIAASRAAVPELIKEVRRLQSFHQEWKDGVAQRVIKSVSDAAIAHTEKIESQLSESEKKLAIAVEALQDLCGYWAKTTVLDSERESNFDMLMKAAREALAKCKELEK